jgi:hypothetical protein
MSNESERKRVEAKFTAACHRLHAANAELDIAEREHRLAREEYDKWWGDEFGCESSEGEKR